MALRWGILGCGDIANKRVADAIRQEPTSMLVAACRRNATKLAAFCEAFDVPRRYERAEDLLADASIDAVYIATPVHLHLPQTLAAAAAGKHVLVEKPMALSVAECRQMVEACAAADVRLGVAYYRRFYASVLRMAELLAAGEIGQPLSVSVVTSTPFAFQPGDDGYWRVIPEQGGGGPLMDIGSHRINLLLELFGEIDRVQSFCDTVAADYEAEDCVSALFRFATGTQGSLVCIFGTPSDPDSFEVLGTAGRFRIAPLNGPDLVVETAAGRRTETVPPPANLHAPLIVDFAQAIEEGRPPTVDGAEGLLTSAVLERVYEANADKYG